MASGGDKFIYFLVGGFVGATVALLFSPKTGEQTREFLENKYKEGSERLSETARQGKERVSEKSLEMAGRVTENINKGKEVLRQQKEQVSAAIDAGKDAYETERHNLQDVSAGKKNRKSKKS
jgi:gas vesicle protein